MSSYELLLLTTANLSLIHILQLLPKRDAASISKNNLATPINTTRDNNRPFLIYVPFGQNRYTLLSIEGGSIKMYMTQLAFVDATYGFTMVEHRHR